MSTGEGAALNKGKTRKEVAEKMPPELVLEDKQQVDRKRRKGKVL